jgi:hypothetical protein
MSVNARLTDQVERDDAVDPNLSFLVSNTWDGDDGRFGALLNVTYTKVRYRDQSITAGALVPFNAATNTIQGLGAALDDCDGNPGGERNTPPDNRTTRRSNASSIPIAAPRPSADRR